MVSCSNEEFTFEERLVNGLSNSDIYYDEVVHYEIKDNFVFVFYTVALLEFIVKSISITNLL